jgi:ATP-dependent helicase/nuclease subunit A
VEHVNSQLPSDIELRERFAKEIHQNFSVGSPAGSGKTHTLVERVAAIAGDANASELLPKQVIVTFTKKSAEEMQSRAREMLLARRASVAVQNAFSRAFFGTIHSFGVSLLRSHGHLIGVPSSFEVVADVETLWYDFLRDASWRDHAEQNPVWAAVLRHIPLQDILKMATEWDVSRPAPAIGGEIPSLNFADIYAFPTPKRADTAANIVAFQKAVRDFEKCFKGEEKGFFALPMAEKGGKDFIATCHRVLRPASLWLQEGATHLAGELFFAFRAWRIARGVLSYDDQISLASLLLQHPEGRRVIRRRGFRILLDEAQDTDPEQFDLLLNCALPENEEGTWRDGVRVEPGRFSMVGDLQQSIYGSRADLATYLAVHSYLTQPGVGESIQFSVTFRCDSAIINASNSVFPAVLNNANGQVPYVTLHPRPNAGEGQVVRLEVPSYVGEGGDEHIIDHEADCVAEFIAKNGPGGLRAANLGQIAILVPRTKWFLPIRSALLRRGIRSTMLSQADYNYDSPAYLWMTAVATVCTDPTNGFEIVGILRDVFGLSDQELGLYAKGNGAIWQIVSRTTGTGSVAESLNHLHDIHAAVLGRPLREAVAIIDEQLLRARLRALPAHVYGDVDASMVPLLATAAAMEAEGSDLREFAAHLRDHLDSKPEIARESPDCVNILTNLKSKGLQWDCVVMPFFARKISVVSPSYPALIGARHTPARFAFSKEDAATFAPVAQQSAQQELERVLYVSLTRAKQTLVIVDDRALFGMPAIPAYSLAAAMKVADENKSFFDGLPTVLTLPARSIAQTSSAEEPAAVDIEAAVNAASKFPRKLTPHSVANEAEASEPGVRTEERLRSHTASEAIVYGIWWHTTMKTMPWAGGRTNWQLHFDTNLVTCVDVLRAKREWDLFLKSELAPMLEDPTAVVVVEAPFMVQTAAGNAMEGVIDLAIRSAAAGWKVIDWKTGLSRTSPSELLGDYEMQVALYREAIKAMTAEDASAALYSTATGSMVGV